MINSQIDRLLSRFRRSGLGGEFESRHAVTVENVRNREADNDWVSSRWGRGVILLLIVVMLELAVFSGHLSGEWITTGDFVGSYNTLAFIWWTDGSIFDPIDWVPNSLGGFPAALVLQDSSWYLPVGIATLVGPYTLHAAAIVAALHVVFGFFGAFSLIRSFGLSFVASTLGGVAGFFAVGFYSNAQHVDIARGYAWVPWVLLVLSPTWPWKKWWGIPLAALIFWQTVMALYPGMLVALVYVGIIWVAVHQMVTRTSPKKFLAPLVWAGVIAALVSAPKLLPHLLLRNAAAETLPDTSRFDLSMVGTLIFGYGAEGFPNDPSMNSFFIPATVAALAFFANYRARISIMAFSLGVPAVLLGLPIFPWFDALQSMPGLGLSRFSMSDFKVFMILAIVLLCASGIERLVAERSAISRSFWIRLALAVGFAVLLAVVRKEGPYTRLDWLPGFALLVVALLLVLSFRAARRSQARMVLAWSLVGLTAVSGTVWTYTTTDPWRTSQRPAVEDILFGASVDELLTRRQPLGDVSQRPARVPLQDGYDEATIRSPVWGRWHYSGGDTVGGYINAKGSETMERLFDALLDRGTGQYFAEFLAGPGLVLAGDARPEQMLACVQEAKCGDIEVMPMNYAPGHFTYRISMQSLATVTLNEAYYPGWAAEACDAGHCAALEPFASKEGLIQIVLPEGSYDLQVRYETPGLRLGNILFALGALSALLAAASVVWRRRPQSIGVPSNRPILVVPEKNH